MPTTLPLPEQSQQLIAILQDRFLKNKERHKDLDWDNVLEALVVQSTKLWSLQEMERTGGEPDVVGFDPQTKEFLFFDCSPESPIGRRSVCYDLAGLESRKEHRPENNAICMAETIGIDLLTEEQYRYLQTLGTFDKKTSSWLKTPEKIRELGGAIFGDLRYGHVFVYHNGAQSYYAARGFRGCLRV